MLDVWGLIGNVKAVIYYQVGIVTACVPYQNNKIAELH
jgi:hypothetical protein